MYLNAKSQLSYSKWSQYSLNKKEINTHADAGAADKFKASYLQIINELYIY